MGERPFYGWYVAVCSFLTLAFTVGIPLYGMPFYYDYFIEVAPGLVRAPGPFEDPNNMGIFAALALVLMVFRFVQAPHRPGARLEMMVLGPLLLAGMVSSLTRSAAAALGLALVILWPRGRGGGRRARLLLISAVVALGLVALARSVAPVLEGTGPADTLGQRPLYWGTAARIALASSIRAV